MPYHEVNDFAQEVWVHLARNQWHALQGWRGLYTEDNEGGSNLAGYLRTITSHKVADLFAAAGRQLPAGYETVDVVDDRGQLGVNPRASTEGDLLFAAFEECSRHFTARDRSLLALWYEGHPDQHTAEVLGMTQGNVQQRRHYLMQILRPCLREKLPEYFSDV